MIDLPDIVIVTIVSCKSPPKEKVKWPEIYSE